MSGRLRRTTAITLFVAGTVLLLPAPAARANLLLNAGFETPSAAAGDQFATPSNSSWTGFNAAFITATTARTGSQSIKFFGDPGGAFQDVAAAPGEAWRGTVWGQRLSTDALEGAQGGFINIEWRDGAGGLISFLSTPVITSASPTDTWIFGEVQGVAPAGTATARLVLLSGPYTGLGGTNRGAAFFDDATFAQVPEPASVAAIGLMGLLALRRRRSR